MSRNAWCTKEDVMKDLARATGMAEVDERCFVYGEMPPPPLQDATDEVVMEDGFLSNMSEERPDLSGIQNYLRMLNGEQEEPTPKNNNGAVVTSKLNTNAKEFVPSNQLNTRTTDNKQPNKTNLVKKDTSPKTNKSSQKNQTEKQSEKHKSKRDKNVALSHLIKPQASEESIASKESIKLLKPSFFELSKSASNCTAHDIVTCSTVNKDHNPPHKVDIDEEILNKITEEIKEDTIKESVVKVDEWLHKGASSVSASATTSPQPKKNPLLFESNLISYKKRDNNASPIPKKEKKSPSPSVDKKFVPTSYAGELRKQYEEKIIKREEEKRASLNIWEKLEYDLKARDKEVRRKAETASRHT